MTSRLLNIFATICALHFTAVIALADDPPAWFLEASKLPVPTFDTKHVPAVVLRNEESVIVNSDGAVIRTARYAIRLLVREGREEAIARVVYQTDSEKIRDINAWLIPKSGTIREFGKKETVDVALAENDLYNEARVRLIDASEIADTGDVFGYETVTEERTIFSQFQFRFQHDLPVLFSRFSLTLPTGWRADGVTFNHSTIQPTVNGSSYSWELRSLAPINYEAQSPSRSSLAPRLAVSFYPTGATATQIRTFSNWSDVAKWMSEVEEPQMTVDDALAAKVQDLTANAKTEFEKIQAISRYVQNIQYISIQVGTGRGGGYRPHSATEVFAKSYGDCKDKANLMRAMLHVLKIPAYLVSITADDREYVRAEWASPHQFNHCIIAVRITDATQAASVIVHPKLGRLLIFDATDPYTPLGDFPEEQQGSLALIDHREVDSLTRMPDMPAVMNRLDRTVEVSLSQQGDIDGKVTEKSIGQSAAVERSRLRRLSSPDYSRMVEGWISRGATGAKAVKISPIDNHAEGNFNLEVEFNAKSYAQIMQGRLMVFKPAVVGRLERLSFTEGNRVHPFVLDATTYSETVKIRLPSGFAVDEMPEPAKLETSFGKYAADYKVIGDELVFTRSLVLNRATIPADKYETIKSFFGSVHAAEQSPVVLIKK